MTSNQLRLIAMSLVLAMLAVGPAATASGHGDGNNGNGDQGDGDHGGPGHGHGHDKDRGNGNDFALFDGSNPANQPNSGAVCGAKPGRPFVFYLTAANFGSAGFIRVTYADGDWIQIPIAAGGSFSMTQAAGSKGGADAAVRVSNGGSPAQLAGALSAQGAMCGSCDADSLGDAGCDKIVPN